MLSSIRSRRLFILASVKFVPSIDGLELRSINGHARCTEQIKLAAQRDKLATDLANGLAIVLAEIRDGFEVGRQLPRQPDQLDVALALPLEPSARRNPIKIAVDIELEHHAGVIAGPAGLEWSDAHKTQLVQIETVDEHVDHPHRVVLAHIIVDRCRKKCALRPTTPSTKRFIQMPPHNRRESYRANHFKQSVFTQPGPFATYCTATRPRSLTGHSGNREAARPLQRATLVTLKRHCGRLRLAQGGQGGPQV